MTTTTTVKFRRTVERAICSRVVKDAIAAGYTLSIDGGGDELDVKNSTDHKEVMDMLFNLDDAHLILKHEDQTLPTGWVRFVFGNEGYTVISDYTVNLEELLAPAQKVAERYEEKFYG